MRESYYPVLKFLNRDDKSNLYLKFQPPQQIVDVQKAMNKIKSMAKLPFTLPQRQKAKFNPEISDADINDSSSILRMNQFKKKFEFKGLTARNFYRDVGLFISPPPVAKKPSKSQTKSIANNSIDDLIN